MASKGVKHRNTVEPLIRPLAAKPSMSYVDQNCPKIKNVNFSEIVRAAEGGAVTPAVLTLVVRILFHNKISKYSKYNGNIIIQYRTI